MIWIVLALYALGAVQALYIVSVAASFERALGKTVARSAAAEIVVALCWPLLAVLVGVQSIRP